MIDQMTATTIDPVTDPMPQTRVLIVDDSSLIRRYMRDALERAGFVVAEAFNGLEAMEHILTHPFDLIVVDVNMPKMDGYAFLHALRARDADISSIPALMISTEAGPQDIDAARAAGANYYLVKPVSQDDLVWHARALTGRSPIGRSATGGSS
jgi:two-component system chemotaxis response regulator CheY